MKKVLMTIEKKLDVKIENVVSIQQDGKEVIADVIAGGKMGIKVHLKEMRNQYGSYFKIVSSKEYEVKEEPEEKPKKFRTKTETLCCKKRNEIIEYAKKAIKALEDGTATFKEIEGPSKSDTAIRLVLMSSFDNSLIKVDISVEELKRS